jgi:hypothetical protein
MIIVLGSICLAWVLTEWAELGIGRINKPHLIKWVCLRCWSFWLCLGVSIATLIPEIGWWTIIYAPLYAGISGLLASEYADWSFKKKEW